MSDAKQAIQVLEAPRQEMALDAVGRRAAIDDLLNKVALVQEVMKSVMHEGEHFGKIPGCGDKPALLKAGAEKLGMTFRLRPAFSIEERDLGKGHREYSIVCTLSDGTQGVGSCNTMESKYRFRQGERKCPECGKATIITGKKEYGGGFLCFAKKGGCGAKFTDTDERIVNQQIGKVEHDNPADFYNTCLKMGKKRAHVDAIITGTACSDIFTQDVEELIGQVDAGSPPTPPPPTIAKAPESPSQPAPSTPAQVKPTTLPNCTVKMVTERQGTKRNGKPYTIFLVLLNDGFNDLEAFSYHKTVGEMAKSVSENGDPAEATIVPGKKDGAWELTSILPVSEPKEMDDVPH